MPGQQRSPPPVAWAGATPDAAWGRIRTPSPGARPLAPHAPPAWSQGMAEKLPQRMAAAAPPPPAPGAPAARRERARAQGPKTVTAMAKKKSGAGPDCLSMPRDFAGVLSVGSVGHPYTCQDACKYVRKTRGCKDGADCSHCHVCVWNRYEASRTTSMKQRSALLAC
ncbi:unnamed protein product [Prorocentrum cordatum]|uniref:C3H1-type domain-containing protein n=1 Tax=Prorocentrum cordatum TaxID=2364126 RepID=A0ABN9TEE4_9DINO|nr:unnamed protein product [Polarella glacialis]